MLVLVGTVSVVDPESVAAVVSSVSSSGKVCVFLKGGGEFIVNGSVEDVVKQLQNGVRAVCESQQK